MRAAKGNRGGYDQVPGVTFDLLADARFCILKFVEHVPRGDEVLLSLRS